MRQRLVVGNWKLNGSSTMVQSLLTEILQGVASSKTEVAVCPPYVYLAAAQSLLKGSTVVLGAQDASDQDAGAYTGEVSVPMLREFSCHYVIVGHSERRSLYAESDEFVANKFAAVCRGGLTPILCVGETLQEREQGQAQQVVARQMDAVIQHESAMQTAESANQFVVAYEPVWAIGTGKTASPEQAQEMHGFIRGHLGRHDADLANTTRILYGGSVKGNNAAELFSQADIDGGLIGGASLSSEDFLAICNAA